MGKTRLDIMSVCANNSSWYVIHCAIQHPQKRPTVLVCDQNVKKNAIYFLKYGFLVRNVLNFTCLTFTCSFQIVQLGRLV